MQIKAKLMELLDKRKAMMEMWQKRWDQLRLRECGDGVWVGRGIFGVIPPPQAGGAERRPFLAVLEVCQFSRDASVAESWLMAQEPYLASSDYGQTVDAVEKLLKRHEAFEKSTATWEERIAALRKLTTVRWWPFGWQEGIAGLPLISVPPCLAAGAHGRADAAGGGRGARRCSRTSAGSGCRAGGRVRGAVPVAPHGSTFP